MKIKWFNKTGIAKQSIANTGNKSFYIIQGYSKRKIKFQKFNNTLINRKRFKVIKIVFNLV